MSDKKQESKNPVLSARIDQETFDRLQKLKETWNCSRAAALTRCIDDTFRAYFPRNKRGEK